MTQPIIISRPEARSRGLQFYFTGEPCKRVAETEEDVAFLKASEGWEDLSG